MASISFLRARRGCRWDATIDVCNGGIRLRIDDLDRLSIYLSLLLSFAFSFFFSLLPFHSIRCVNDPTQVREKEATLRSHKVHLLKWIINSSTLLAAMRKLFLADTLNAYLDNYFLLAVIYCAIVFINIYLSYCTPIDWKTFLVLQPR